MLWMKRPTPFFTPKTWIPLYPSAAVKIMTCLVALENSALTDNVTMTATGVAGAVDGGANIAAQADEVFTMEQCLYAIMLASANDISCRLPEHIGGSVDGFVEKMNARAQSLDAPIHYLPIQPVSPMRISIRLLTIWHSL